MRGATAFHPGGARGIRGRDDQSVVWRLPQRLERLYFLVEYMEETFHLGYRLSTGEAAA